MVEELGHAPGFSLRSLKKECAPPHTGPSSPGSLCNLHVPGTSDSSRPLFSTGSGWGNQDSSGGGRGSSGGGVGIRGGGRMCRSLDTSEGRVTSPPCRRERPAGGGGHRVQPGGWKVSQALGRRPTGTHTRKNSLSWGLLLSAGMCTVKRSKSSAPFRRSSITEASNRPAAARTRGRERSDDPQGPLAPRPLFLVLPGGDLSSQLPPIPFHQPSSLTPLEVEVLVRRDQSLCSSIFWMFIEHLLCGSFRRSVREKQALCPHRYHILDRGRQVTN